jgi:LysR family transcriptional regulator for metE and metH
VAVRFEVRDLRLVAAIADLGTLTRAGQQLHLSQSALSHQLADLEYRLGGALFERAGRRMIPTGLGDRLAARARATLRGLEDVETEIGSLAAGHTAVLRIATECYTCFHWLPPVLREFRVKHPNVDVRIVPSATDRPVRALIAGTIDLCIVNLPVRDRRVTTTPLFSDELVLVVSPDHPLADRESVDPSELRDERFLLYSAPERSHVFQRVLAPAGVSPSQVSSLQLTEALLELVTAGLGITVLARWAAQPALTAGTLVAIPIASPNVLRHWQVATRAGKVTHTYVHDFTGFLRNTFAHPPRARPEFTILRSVAKLSKARR